MLGAGAAPCGPIGTGGGQLCPRQDTTSDRPVLGGPTHSHTLSRPGGRRAAGGRTAEAHRSLTDRQPSNGGHDGLPAVHTGKEVVYARAFQRALRRTQTRLPITRTALFALTSLSCLSEFIMFYLNYHFRKIKKYKGSFWRECTCYSLCYSDRSQE